MATIGKILEEFFRQYEDIQRIKITVREDINERVIEVHYYDTPTDMPHAKPTPQLLRDISTIFKKCPYIAHNLVAGQVLVLVRSEPK